MNDLCPRLTAVVALATIVISVAAVAHEMPATTQAMHFDVEQIDRLRVMKHANAWLNDPPITVTAEHSPRSAGGVHDFFSEGDYWWPDPNDPNAPYVQRDGMTNPDNFVAHRHAMIRFSRHVAAFTSAWRITGDKKYADAALKHLRAWFIEEQTRMNPNLQYAQAIKGRFTGRGIGIIDTVHLIEVARSAGLLQQAGILRDDDLAGTNKWFTDYLTWMTTSKNGLDEMNAENNHGTCWAMQVAAFASFTGDQDKLAMVRKRFKEVLLPGQMAPDGSFPRELKRTKPYGYSLFNLDAMTTLCWIASTKDDDLWQFTTPDGRNMRKGIEYMAPYIADKSKWPLKPDVMYYDQWPVRSPSLLFGGLAYHQPQWLELWKSLPDDPENDEVIRNLPIRYPVLWVD